MDFEEWISNGKEKAKTKFSNKRLLTATFILILVSASLFATWAFAATLNGEKESGNLDVEIMPRQAKLYPGQSQLFSVVLYNGTAPFTYRWESNGTYLASSPTVDFSFQTACEYTVLSVCVTDSKGNIGFDSVFVYDPAFESRLRYFDASMPYSYLVESNGTHAFMMNGTTHQMEASGIDQDQIINWALGNLTVGRTWQETVWLMGNFTIDSPLRVYSHTKIVLACEIYLEANSDCNMIENAEWNAHDVVIAGSGRLFGDYENQNSGHGIYWRINGTNPDSQQYPFSLTISPEELRIHYIKQDGVHIDMLGSSGTFQVWIENLHTFSCRRYGIYWYCVYDSYLQESWIGGNAKNFYQLYCTSNHISDCYFGGGVSEEVMLAHWMRATHFTNCRWDNGASSPVAQEDFVRLTGNCSGNTFIGGGITSTDNLINNNTEVGLSIEDDSHDNLFSGFYIGVRTDQTGTNKLKYGIVEIENADYNMICCVNARDVATAGIMIVGENTKVSDSWNGTSWIS